MHLKFKRVLWTTLCLSASLLFLNACFSGDDCWRELGNTGTPGDVQAYLIPVDAAGNNLLQGSNPLYHPENISFFTDSELQESAQILAWVDTPDNDEPVIRLSYYRDSVFIRFQVDSVSDVHSFVLNIEEDMIEEECRGLVEGFVLRDVTHLESGTVFIREDNPVMRFPVE